MEWDMLINTKHFKAFKLLLCSRLNPNYVLNKNVAGSNGFIEHPTQTQIKTNNKNKKAERYEIIRKDNQFLPTRDNRHVMSKVVVE
jgi:hypothetical protein